MATEADYYTDSASNTLGSNASARMLSNRDSDYLDEKQDTSNGFDSAPRLEHGNR